MGLAIGSCRVLPKVPVPPSSRLFQAVRFGGFVADPRSGELYRDGAKIKLQEQPFKILTILLGRAVAHDGESNVAERGSPNDAVAPLALEALVSQRRSPTTEVAAENTQVIEEEPDNNLAWNAARELVDPTPLPGDCRLHVRLAQLFAHFKLRR